MLDPFYIMGIETSCDDTGVAILLADRSAFKQPNLAKPPHVLSQMLHQQTQTHSLYGGVVPELSSRDHIQHLLPSVKKALRQAQINEHHLHGIAYTAGPGLVGALLVGAMFARSLAFALGCVHLPVHHLEAHILVTLLACPTLTFPFLTLLVSGGHTQLIQAQRQGRYLLLGQSLDDAAGEAFDKTARLLNLKSFPGGAALAELAKQGKPNQYRFSRPLIDRDNCDFSFSGLKTQVRYAWERSGQTQDDAANIAYAFQEAMIDCLVSKTKKALAQTGLKQVVIAGGVAANHCLRQQMASMTAAQGVQLYCPKPDWCTDNGVMVAYTGYCHLVQKLPQPTLDFQVKPRWLLNEL